MARLETNPTRIETRASRKCRRPPTLKIGEELPPLFVESSPRNSSGKTPKLGDEFSSPRFFPSGRAKDFAFAGRPGSAPNGLPTLEFY